MAFLYNKIMIRLSELRSELKKYSSSEKAEKNAWFFKTEKGQYGYGDKFIGVTMPEQRAIAKKYFDLSPTDLEKLLASPIHEERSVALILLCKQFEKGDDKKREEIFEFYASHSKYMNNWDLVDGSAPRIVGEYLLDKKITLLIMYAKSGDLWEKRIAMISTFAFINKGRTKETYLIADLLLDEKHDLLQKAVGWMLRETGKRVSIKDLEKYLATRYKKMGRTALRYAIEHFPKEEREKYLKGRV